MILGDVIHAAERFDLRDPRPSMVKYAAPIPHAIYDGFLTPHQVREINAQWPADDAPTWRKEDGRMNLKWSTNELPPAARAVVDTFDTKVIEDAIDVPAIIADPDGGALHCIPCGGFLNMHYDFNLHQVTGWRRRANALIYLNEIWQDDWNGHLQLGLADRGEVKEIAPLGGRMVVFETTDKPGRESWHGHPRPLRCPEGVQRRSLALYFYTNDALPGEKRHTTIYATKRRELA